MVETTQAAIAGGATIIQLRDKRAGTEGLIRIGRELMDAMRGTGVPEAMAISSTTLIRIFSLGALVAGSRGVAPAIRATETPPLLS